MCGLAGYFNRAGLQTGSNDILAMIRAIRHRGPDDEGFAFINTRSGDSTNASGAESDPRVRERLPAVEDPTVVLPHDIAFAHRRFSIIDLTPSGYQPMWDRESRVCVSFNGEIYNYVELRDELERHGYRFDTRSDTEVLLNAYLHWGTEAFSRFNGPLALALFDTEKQRLLLARDRIGKVPLYYTIRHRCLYWGSEIQAIFAACDVGSFPISEHAVDVYLRHGLRDVDGTFLEGVEDFPVASFAWVHPNLSLEVNRYWDLPRERHTAKDIGVEDASATFKELLWDATRVRMRAEAPVAFELSGGMDSSALVAIAAAKNDRTVPTYTVRFEEKHSNEEPFARAVAERYSDTVDYHVIRPGENDFWEAANDFVPLQEEPFHSPNLYTSQELQRRISQDGVRVVLGGAGGDEVLAGYSTEYLLPFLSYLGQNGQYGRLVSEFLMNSELSVPRLSKAVFSRLLRRVRRGPAPGDRERRVLESIYTPSRWHPTPDRSDELSERMLQNMTSRRMNYWLRSGNKTSMSVPIEARSPFLDYRVVDARVLASTGVLDSKWLAQVAASPLDK